MTSIAVVTFIIGVAAALFTAGVLYRENNKNRSGMLILSSFITLLVLALNLFTSPISYQTGTSIDDSGTPVVVTNTYTELSSLSSTLALIMVLVALFGIQETSSRLYRNRTDRNSGFNMEDE